LPIQKSDDLAGGRIVTAKPVVHITGDFDFRDVRFKMGTLR